MSVYLGNAGAIKLRRAFGYTATESITSSKVVVNDNRLVISTPATAFVTGDRVRIDRDGAGNVDFVVGGGSFEELYVNANPLLGLRFFQTWSEALLNRDADVTQLQAPTGTYDITIEKIDQNEQKLGQIETFEFSTSRNSEQVLSLNEEFTRNVTTAISGSGSIQCFWGYDSSLSGEEQANFFNNLILSQQIQSEFTAALVIKSQNAAPEGQGIRDDREFFYLINALVTNVAMSFTATDVVRSQINFVTTGEIQLLFGDTFTLLQENSSKIQLENDGLLQGYA